MVYKKQFALSIRANGKILREREDKVFIPFGTQYEIVMKNLNSCRASVQVWVDGELVSGIVPIVIEGNDTFVLKRSFSRGTESEGNSFKFIERIERIEEFRGIRIDDGMIRVEYQFEERVEEKVREVVRTYEKYIEHRPVFYPQPYYSPYYSPYNPIYCADPNYKLGISYSSQDSSAIASSVGITAPGEKVEQSIPQKQTSFLFSGEKNVLVLQMIGCVEERKVEKVVDVKMKIKCGVCGKSSRGSVKFCSGCGSSLQIV